MRSRAVLFPLSFVAILAFAGTASAQDKWLNDAAHSGAYFQNRYNGLDYIRGSFHKMTVTVLYDGKDISKATIDATIDAASIDTDVEPRDRDLKSDHYFDVEKYPNITFKSKSVSPAGAGKLRVTGDLTLHGVTKEVVLDVDGPTPIKTDDKGVSFMGAEATTRINRKDFGITMNPALADEVMITLELDLVKRPPPAGSN
jgi:polyisoprenoid-binding protein YceI